MSRNYSNVAVATTLNGAVTDVATSWTVTDGSTYPATPFAALCEDEVVLVTVKSGTNDVTWTVTRAYDGTTGVAHSDTDPVEHVVIADDFPSGLAATLIGDSSATGTSPHSLTVPAGTASGDLVIVGVATRNSVMAAGNLTGGSAWTNALLVDLLTNEWTAVWYKIAGGSEPASYTLTHSAGALAQSASTVLRGPTTFMWAIGQGDVAPSVPGVNHGGAVIVYMGTYATGGTEFVWNADMISAGIIEDAGGAYNTDQQVKMVYTDTVSPAGIGSAFGSGGSDTGFGLTWVGVWT